MIFLVPAKISITSGTFSLINRKAFMLTSQPFDNPILAFNRPHGHPLGPLGEYDERVLRTCLDNVQHLADELRQF